MSSESLSLPNGGLWPDAAGVHVNAHGGGLLKEGGLWYWYGEHKTAGRAGNPANGLGPEKTWGAQSTFATWIFMLTFHERLSRMFPFSTFVKRRQTSK